jgi:hypothetical protein
MNYKLPVFLYHGSTYIIKDKLEPRSSIVINNKKAVFATPEKMIALSFLPNWDNSHFEHGSFNNKKNLTIIEKSKNNFNKYFNNKKGYIYKVRSNTFKNDKRLGLQGWEFISKKSVKIVSCTKINNVLLELKKCKKVNLIEFEDIKYICFNKGPSKYKKIKYDSFNYNDLKKIKNNTIIICNNIDYKDINKYIQFGNINNKKNKLCYIKKINVYINYDSFFKKY